MKQFVIKYAHSLKNSTKKLWRVVSNKRNRKKTLWGIALGLCLILIFLYISAQHLIANYKNLESVRIEDRNGVTLTLLPNAKGAYVHYSNAIPPKIKKLLIKKEDRFFYFHPGINPLSTARALFKYSLGNHIGGASTITQQLVKNILGNEQDRSVANKAIEMFYAVSLELFTSKEDILTMYANTVYMGNQIQGLYGASELYFGKKLEDLDDTKIAMLLATLSSPSTENPWKGENATASRNLAKRIGVVFDPSLATITQKHPYTPPKNFELASMQKICTATCKTTLDADLTNRLRKVLNKHVQQGWDAGARSGAIVVLKLPENELLAIIGTPNPESYESGQQINMAIQPRPIGSTAKPFIYLEGFKKGLRPYSLVNDREYKFPIGSGFPLYPKNYDGTYRGWITLHSALSNSLNVPTVQTLKFVGLNNFYDFLEHSLGFIPLQDLDTYQYGIALGALEMDPLTLAHFLSIFPENGVLKPVQLFMSGTTTPMIATPMSKLTGEKKIADPALTALVSKVLHDRLSGVQQFGLASSLNLSQSNYAVKTGTSQDYHDSWTVGYTPDFLVVVWFGNPDNTPLKHITGQSGAGGIWHDAMELLMNSAYNKKTPLNFSEVEDFLIQGSIDFGISGDVVKEHRNLLPDETLILSPQNDDMYLKEARTSIPLISRENVSWYVNDEFLGMGTRISFFPPEARSYTIKAVSERGNSAHIIVQVIER